jgi:molybdopterin converting factor small subunit
MIRVVLPTHLWRLAGTQREVSLEIAGVPTLTTVLDALEAQYPVLRGTIRDHTSKKRRDFVRFFVCGEDWSHDQTEAPLPEEVLSGKEPVRIIGALAGG